MPAAIALAFGLPFEPELTPRYNIAPSQMVPTVRVDLEGRRVLAHARWGFVPHWSREVGRQPINARNETIRTSGMWRGAYKLHRCLLPASGYYEWKAMETGRKQPFRIAMPGDEVFALGGVWSRWKPPEGDSVDTVAIVTAPGPPSVAHLHDRAPLIVRPEDFDRWLDPEEPDPADVLERVEQNLRSHRVGLRVSNARNEGPDLIEPVPADA